MDRTLFPLPNLRTERLHLRSMTLADAEDLAERRSDPVTAEFQSWIAPYPVERARALIAEVTEHSGPTPGAWYQMAIERLEDSRVVGDVAVYLGENGKTAEVGYTLHAWARGEGYATEAATALIDFLVDVVGVHRIEATTHPDNISSHRLLGRLGFTAEGVKRESYWVGDVVTDDAIFGLLAREWLARRSTERAPSA